MSKMRVYEYAKKQSTSSREVIEKLKSINVNVTNHMSSIDGETISKLDSMFKGNDRKEKQTKQESKQRGGQNSRKGKSNQRQAQGQKSDRNQKPQPQSQQG